MFQMMLGHPSFDPAQAAPARRLGRGRARDHAQHHRAHGRARPVRRLRPVGSLAQRRAQRLSRSGRAADRRAGASRTTASRCASPTRDRRGAAGGRAGRDPGARLERDARLLQEPGRDRQGLHARRLAAHRRPRRARPTTAGCAWSAAPRTSSASAARTSRRPRSRRCCTRIPRSRRAGDRRAGRAAGRGGAAFVTLKGERARPGRADRVRASAHAPISACRAISPSSRASTPSA